MIVEDVFIGQILAWSSSIIPTNWQICDGTDGTPDLRDLFVRCASSDGEVGATSGASSHTHISSSGYGGSSHNHGGSASGNTNSGGTNSSRAYGSSWAGADSHTHTISMSIGNGGASHSHGTSLVSANSLPPYTYLYYIMKVA